MIVCCKPHVASDCKTSFPHHREPMPKKPPKIAVIDCETDPFLYNRLPRPFVWGFFDGDTYKHFPTIVALLEWLATYEEPLCIYAHNGGKFDYHFMLEHLQPFTGVLIIHGRLARFTIGKHEFRDSYNILPIPLREYRKDDIDYRKLEEKVRAQHMPEILAYLKTDCVALYEIVQRFIVEYGFSLTLAGCAMKTWAAMCDVEAPSSCAGYYATLKKYYYGGRVQCFHVGEIKKPFAMFDINSAYPYAMLSDHPFSTTAKVCCPGKDDALIMQSFYTVEGVSRGAFPWKEEDKAALHFPEDDESRVYHITGWELKAALETGTFDYHILHQRVDFGADIDFQHYIGHFYEMKKKSAKGTPEYIFAKLFMNSLYGKFGANPDVYKNYGIVPEEYTKAAQEDRDLKLGKNSGPWTWGGSLGPWSLMVGKDPDTGETNPTKSRYYNVATAASITGFVRAYLWRHICAIRNAGGTALYCDTDSIVAMMPDGVAAPFVMGKELGEWGDDGQFSEGAIAGKKMYAFKLKKPIKDVTWKTASKGVRLDAQSIVAIVKGAELGTIGSVPSYSVLSKKGPTFVPRMIRRTA